MKASLAWLKNYIDLDYSPDKISEMLTTIGLEVEGLEEVEQVKGGLKGIVVGEVLTCERHPNADKLFLTTVNIGEGQVLQIVCGAPNVAKGQKVPVATVGTILYDKSGEAFTLKKGKIRGEISEGMICSEDELGLSQNHDGIMVLDPESIVGKGVADLLKLSSDIVFEIGLTPNRSDANCHRGIARDLYSYLIFNENYNSSFKIPVYKTPAKSAITLDIELAVQNLEACPRYSALSLVNVKVGPSPEWLRTYLQAIGVKSINNVVDITNYILHDMGQPLHAFDADKIAEGKVIVTTLEKGKKFTTLDSQIIELDQEDLMICDANKFPMCMAGVYGGLHSGVTDSTTKIFLESAHFNASSIRRSSMRHDFRTDAAKVFEKGSDPSITVEALQRAAFLLCEYAGAKIASELIDFYPNEILPAQIRLSIQRVKDLLGVDISEENVLKILGALNMEAKKSEKGVYIVSVPTDKADVTREVDLIEEILRIYGINNIPATNKIISSVNYSLHPRLDAFRNELAASLTGKGFAEMMGISLIPSKISEKSGLDEDLQVKINNTSNIHLDTMRYDMMVSGLQSVAYNLNRQQLNLKLFEFGKKYQKKQHDDGFEETELLSIFITGKWTEESWLSDSGRDAGFFDLKEILSTIMTRSGFSDCELSELKEDPRVSYGLKYHQGPSMVAMMGEVHPGVLKEFGIKQKVWYGELAVQKLYKKRLKVKKYVEEPSRFPAIRRDLALLLDTHISFDQVKKIVEKTLSRNLVELNLFDVYENSEQLGKDKKSYAISMIFEDKEKTFNDKQIDSMLNKLIEKLGSELGAVIRK
jgi:phenylalanyl-tRNA synthetase beta chain